MTTTDTTIETRHDRRITVDHYDDKTVLEIVNTSTGRVLGAGLTPVEARQIAAALDPGRAAGGQWTRDDFARLDIHPLSPAGDVIDQVVAWLNAHYPKPQPYDQGGVRGADSLLYRAERAERERDDAVARAEQAGARVRLANQQSVEWEGEAERLLCERDEWKARAEAAEARTAPAVTCEHRDAVADHLWNAMVGSAKSVVRDVVAQAFVAAGIEVAVEAEAAADPAVHVVRESDLPAARVDGDYYVVASAKGDYKWPQHGPSWWAGRAQDALAKAARYTSLALLAADREATVNPVEEKAIELHQVAYGGRIGFGHATLNAQEMFRSLARHVLGQEADDE